MTQIQGGIFRRGFDPHTPIYLQIMEELRRALARGELRPGDRVPAVRELAARLLVNPNTVQRAYQELEREGLLVTRRGQGTFVADGPAVVREIRERLAAEAVGRFLAEMADLGFGAEEALALLAARRGGGGHRPEEGDA